MSLPSQAQLDAAALENFREYLQICSVQPNVNYDECVAFLHKQAQSLDLPIKVYHICPKKPIVVLTWIGTEPNERTILLNSHMDVVPVFENKWIYEPFSAHMDDKGDIYARGSQDMKSVGIQYLEAIRQIKLRGERVKRTIHISFVPDEEIGGEFGMRKFVHTDDFRALNVGFAMDEGAPSPKCDFFLIYGERSIWHIDVKCEGTPGHASRMLKDTPGEKIRVIIDKFMDFREEQMQKLENNGLKPGEVTSVNLTQLQGGVQPNVIPADFTAVFDIRLALTEGHEQFEAMIQEWCKEAGNGVTYIFKQKDPKVESTKLDKTNPFWVAFKKTCDEIGVNLCPLISPGGTDSRYIRMIDIPALGFSPMNNTKIRLHDHNEYLNKDIFIKGIEIYTKIIPAVANV